MNQTIDEIKAKGKNHAIITALNFIIEREPSLQINPDDFEIKVLANSTKILVQLRRIIRYIPLRIQETDNIKYDITVDLLKKTISPFDDVLKSTFYIPTKSDIEAIAFVKMNFGIFNPAFEVTISEEENHYAVYLQNQFSYSTSKINKTTGIEESLIQGSYLPIPKTELSIETDPLTELNP